MSNNALDKAKAAIIAIKSSPQYIQELYLHDRSCDMEKTDKGLPDGKIYQIVTTPGGLQERWVDCMYCKRIRQAKERKHDGQSTKTAQHQGTDEVHDGDQVSSDSWP